MFWSGGNVGLYAYVFQVPVLNMTEHQYRDDHDLLVAMSEQIKQVRVDIQDLKDGTSTKIADHELRLRRLELWGAMAIGGAYAVEFYFNFIKG